MAYTDEGKIEKYLAIDIDTSFSTQVEAWITSVSAWIDNYCGKGFESESATKYYDGNGCPDIIIDDFVGEPTEVSVLNNDGVVERTLTEGASNDYITYPLNESWHNQLTLSIGASYSVWPSGDRRIKVIASFGRSVAVPKDVELIATKLVAQILSKGIDGGKLSRTKLGDMEANFMKIDEAADALGIYNTLDMYRDVSI